MAEEDVGVSDELPIDELGIDLVVNQDEDFVSAMSKAGRQFTTFSTQADRLAASLPQLNGALEGISTALFNVNNRVGSTAKVAAALQNLSILPTGMKKIGDNALEAGKAVETLMGSLAKAQAEYRELLKVKRAVEGPEGAKAAKRSLEAAEGVSRADRATMQGGRATPSVRKWEAQPKHLDAIEPLWSDKGLADDLQRESSDGRRISEELAERLRKALVQSLDQIDEEMMHRGAVKVGEMTAAGIADGLLAATPEVAVASSDMGVKLLAAIRQSLGIASPSKEAIALGENFGKSFAAAIAGEVAAATAAGTTLGEAAQQAVAASFKGFDPEVSAALGDVVSKYALGGNKTAMIDMAGDFVYAFMQATADALASAEKLRPSEIFEGTNVVAAGRDVVKNLPNQTAWPRAAAQEKPPDDAGSIPFMITRDMRQRLSDLGYNRGDQDKMSTAEAWDVLKSRKAKDRTATAPAAPSAKDLAEADARQKAMLEAGRKAAEEGKRAEQEASDARKRASEAAEAERRRIAAEEAQERQKSSAAKAAARRAEMEAAYKRKLKQDQENAAAAAAISQQRDYQPLGGWPTAGTQTSREISDLGVRQQTVRQQTVMQEESPPPTVAGGGAGGGGASGGARADRGAAGDDEKKRRAKATVPPVAGGDTLAENTRKLNEAADKQTGVVDDLAKLVKQRSQAKKNKDTATNMAQLLSEDPNQWAEAVMGDFKPDQLAAMAEISRNESSFRGMIFQHRTHLARGAQQRQMDMAWDIAGVSGMVPGTNIGGSAKVRRSLDSSGAGGQGPLGANLVVRSVHKRGGNATMGTGILWRDYNNPAYQERMAASRQEFRGEQDFGQVAAGTPEWETITKNYSPLTKRFPFQGAPVSVPGRFKNQQEQFLKGVDDAIQKILVEKLKYYKDDLPAMAKHLSSEKGILGFKELFDADEGMAQYGEFGPEAIAAYIRRKGYSQKSEEDYKSKHGDPQLVAETSELYDEARKAIARAGSIQEAIGLLNKVQDRVQELFREKFAAGEGDIWGELANRPDPVVQERIKELQTQANRLASDGSGQTIGEQFDAAAKAHKALVDSLNGNYKAADEAYGNYIYAQSIIARPRVSQRQLILRRSEEYKRRRENLPAPSADERKEFDALVEQQRALAAAGRAPDVTEARVKEMASAWLKNRKNTGKPFADPRLNLDFDNAQEKARDALLRKDKYGALRYRSPRERFESDQMRREIDLRDTTGSVATVTEAEKARMVAQIPAGDIDATLKAMVDEYNALGEQMRALEDAADKAAQKYAKKIGKTTADVRKSVDDLMTGDRKAWSKAGKERKALAEMTRAWDDLSSQSELMFERIQGMSLAISRAADSARQGNRAKAGISYAETGVFVDPATGDRYERGPSGRPIIPGASQSVMHELDPMAAEAKRQEEAYHVPFPPRSLIYHKDQAPTDNRGRPLPRLGNATLPDRLRKNHQDEILGQAMEAAGVGRVDPGIVGVDSRGYGVSRAAAGMGIRVARLSREEQARQRDIKKRMAADRQREAAAARERLVGADAVFSGEPAVEQENHLRASTLKADDLSGQLKGLASDYGKVIDQASLAFNKNWAQAWESIEEPSRVFFARAAANVKALVTKGVFSKDAGQEFEAELDKALAALGDLKGRIGQGQGGGLKRTELVAPFQGLAKRARNLGGAATVIEEQQKIADAAAIEAAAEAKRQQQAAADAARGAGFRRMAEMNSSQAKGWRAFNAQQSGTKTAATQATQPQAPQPAFVFPDDWVIRLINAAHAAADKVVAALGKLQVIAGPQPAAAATAAAATSATRAPKGPADISGIRADLTRTSEVDIYRAAHTAMRQVRMANDLDPDEVARFQAAIDEWRKNAIKAAADAINAQAKRVMPDGSVVEEQQTRGEVVDAFRASRSQADLDLQRLVGPEIRKTITNQEAAVNERTMRTLTTAFDDIARAERATVTALQKSGAPAAQVEQSLREVAEQAEAARYGIAGISQEAQSFQVLDAQIDQVVGGFRELGEQAKFAARQADRTPLMQRQLAVRTRADSIERDAERLKDVASRQLGGKVPQTQLDALVANIDSATAKARGELATLLNTARQGGAGAESSMAAFNLELQKIRANAALNVDALREQIAVARQAAQKAAAVAAPVAAAPRGLNWDTQRAQAAATRDWGDASRRAGRVGQMGYVDHGKLRSVVAEIKTAQQAMENEIAAAIARTASGTGQEEAAAVREVIGQYGVKLAEANAQLRRMESIAATTEAQFQRIEQAVTDVQYRIDQIATKGAAKIDKSMAGVAAWGQEDLTGADFVRPLAEDVKTKIKALYQQAMDAASAGNKDMVRDLVYQIRAMDRKALAGVQGYINDALLTNSVKRVDLDNSSALSGAVGDAKATVGQVFQSSMAVDFSKQQSQAAKRFTSIQQRMLADTNSLVLQALAAAGRGETAVVEEMVVKIRGMGQRAVDEVNRTLAQIRQRADQVDAQVERIGQMQKYAKDPEGFLQERTIGSAKQGGITGWINRRKLGFQEAAASAEMFAAVAKAREKFSAWDVTLKPILNLLQGILSTVKQIVLVITAPVWLPIYASLQAMDLVAQGLIKTVSRLKGLFGRAPAGAERQFAFDVPGIDDKKQKVQQPRNVDGTFAATGRQAQAATPLVRKLVDTITLGATKASKNVDKLTTDIGELGGAANKATAQRGMKKIFADMGTGVGLGFGMSFSTGIINAIQNMGWRIQSTITGVISRGFAAVVETEMRKMSMRSLAALQMTESTSAGSDFGAVWEDAGVKAEDYYQTVVDIAKFSSFSRTPLLDAFQKFQVAGLTGENARQAVTAATMFGDAFQPGNKQMIDTFGTQAGQMLQYGVAQTQDIKLMGEQGIPVFKFLAQNIERYAAMGLEEAKKAVAEDITKGEIGGVEAFEAIIQGMVEAAGNFKGKAATTFSGLMSTFQDLMLEKSEAVMGPVAENLFKPLMEFANIFIQSNPVSEAITNFGKQVAETAAIITNALGTALGTIYGLWNSLPAPIQEVIRALALAATIMGGLTAALTGATVIGALLAHILPVVTGGMLAATGAVGAFVAAYSTNLLGFRDWLNGLAAQTWATIQAIGQTLAWGMLEAVGSVSQFGANIINTFMSDFMGNAERIYAAVYTWGQGVATAIGGGLNIVSGWVQSALSWLWALPTGMDDILGAIGQWFNDLGAGFGGALTWLGEWASGAVEVMWAIPENMAGIVDQMFEYGGAIVEVFAQGMQGAINVVFEALSAIGGMFSEWLEPHSPPKLLPDLDKWGTAAADIYLQGWTKADFGVFNDLSSKLEEALSMDEGALDEGQFSAIRNAIAEMVGKAVDLGQADISSIMAAVPGWGGRAEQVSRLAQAYANLAVTQHKLTVEQDMLDRITARYEARLVPLQNKLKSITNKQEDLDLGKQIKEWQRVLDNVYASDEQKKAARLKMDELDLTKQINDVEMERDALTDPINDRIAALTTENQVAQDALDLANERWAVEMGIMKTGQGQDGAGGGEDAADKADEGAAGAEKNRQFTQPTLSVPAFKGVSSLGAIGEKMKGVSDKIGGYFEEMGKKAEPLTKAISGIGGGISDMAGAIAAGMASGAFTTEGGFSGFLSNIGVVAGTTIATIDTLKLRIDSLVQAWTNPFGIEPGQGESGGAIGPKTADEAGWTDFGSFEPIVTTTEMRLSAVVEDLQFNLDDAKLKLTTFSTDVKTAFDGVDWVTLKTDVSEGLTDVTGAIRDWVAGIPGKIAEALGSGLTGNPASDAMAGTKKVDQEVTGGISQAGEIARKFIEWLTGEVAKIDFFTVAVGAAGSVLTFAGLLIKWMLDTINELPFSEIMGTSGTVTGKIIAGAIIGTIFAGINLAVLGDGKGSGGSLAQTIVDLAGGVVAFVVNAIVSIFVDISLSIVQPVVDVVNGIIDLINSVPLPGAPKLDHLEPISDETRQAARDAQQVISDNVSQPVSSVTGESVSNMAGALGAGPKAKEWEETEGTKAAAAARGIPQWAIDSGDYVIPAPVSSGAGVLAGHVAPGGQQEAQQRYASTPPPVGSSVVLPTQSYTAADMSAYMPDPAQQQAIGEGVATGISTSTINQMTLEIPKVVDSMLEGFFTALGIHSPSAVMQDRVGLPVGQGIIAGIQMAFGGGGAGAEGAGPGGIVASAYQGILAATATFALSMNVAFFNLKSRITSTLGILKEEWTGVFEETFTGLQEQFDAFATSWVEEKTPALKDAMIELATQAKDGIIQVMTDAVTGLSGKIQDMLSALQSEDVKASFYSAGYGLGGSLVDGIVVAMTGEDADDKFRDMADAVIAEIMRRLKEASGTASPSKVTRDEIGLPLAQGIAVGMSMPKATRYLETSADNVIEQIVHQFGGATAAIRVSDNYLRQPEQNIQSHGGGSRTYILNLAVTPQQAVQTEFNYRIMEVLG
jgi:hypothetical protein